MCGISGIYHPGGFEGKGLAKLTGMLSSLKHRGPDATETYNSLDICLGAVRLSMVDSLNPYALIQNKEKDLILSYNGEIYNYKELRSYLQNKGYTFTTQSDGEVILYLYQEKGLNFLNELDGMFAFALWIQKRKTLLLARDPLGIKPLYYQRNEDTLFFASEIKALLAAYPHSPSIDLMGLYGYYNYRFVPAPRTIYQGISKLEPGQCLISTPNHIFLKKFWTPGFHKEKKTDSLLEIIENATIETLSGDHSLGVFLSGGLDSSTLLSVLHHKKYPCISFSVGYDCGKDENESSQALSVAQHFLSEHRSFTIPAKDLPCQLDEVARFLDEPLYSTVSVSTLALAKFASQYVKGVLTGDGADELFLGYEYLTKPFISLQRNEKNWRDIYKGEIGWIDSRFKKYLLDPSVSDDLEYEESLLPKDVAPLDSMRYFEIRHRLPEYHLCRVDRLTMSQGLEARLPFLRKKVVEWSLNQPSLELLGRYSQKKHLKESFRSRLPQFVLEKQKQPFTTPTAQWLQTVLKEEVYDLFHTTNHIELGLNRELSVKILENFYRGEMTLWRTLWGLYILFKWYKNV